MTCIRGGQDSFWRLSDFVSLSVITKCTILDWHTDPEVFTVAAVDWNYYQQKSMTTHGIIPNIAAEINYSNNGSPFLFEKEVMHPEMIYRCI